MRTTPTTVQHGTVTRTPLSTWRLTLSTPSPNAPARALATLADGLEVSVPGSVLGALIDAGLASDVTVNGHEADVVWAAESSWAYTTSVPRLGDGAHVRLVLEGVDTLASVTVDDIEAVRADDMFHAWTIDLGTDDAEGAWQVRVTFDSVLPVIAAAEKEHPLPRADMYELAYNQVRKMACSFGWDWGPTTVTAGLWRAAHVERTPTARLANVLLSTRWDGEAHLQATITADGPAEWAAVEVRDPSDGRVLAAATTRLVDGAGGVEFAVPGALPWNVVGRGEQPLYDVSVVAELSDGTLGDSVQRRVGFRTITLRQEPDDLGTTCEIHVNGSRVWARGFNWIPSDVLPERVTREHTRLLIEEAVATGANMLRVWGGGVIESDDFFDICDELGVLVWQDFSFACAAYAEDDAQAARVTREVEDAVARVGHRASLALWCGCNENLWAWEDWGWKDKLGANGAWGRRLYYEVIPAVLGVLDPARPYIPGSPFSPDENAHPNDGTQGTTHHWDTWNELDYVHFETKHSRFASEFGWQAPASWSTLTRALGHEPGGADDADLERLQKHPQGMAALARAIADHVPHLVTDAPSWHFATQLVQARAIKASIGRFRSLHDTCSGALWWQLNDCWPALSWSVLDVAGHRKLAWYGALGSMSARAVIDTAPDSPYGLTLVNDLPAVWAAQARVTVASEDGTVLCCTTIDVSIPADGHLVVAPERVDAGAAVVIVDIDGVRGCRWIVPDLELEHPTAVIDSVEVTARPTAAEITVTAGTLIRDLCLLAEFDPALADATVDRQLSLLLPGESVTFTVVGPGVDQVSSLRWASLLLAGTAITIR